MSTIDPGSAALGAAGIAAAAALVGAGFGNWFGSRSEHQQWLRDRRAESCARLLPLLMRARTEAMHKITMERQDPVDFDETERTYPYTSEGEARVQSLVSEVRQAATIVGMYASSDVGGLALTAYRAFEHYMAVPFFDAEEAEEGYGEVEDSVIELSEKVREELKVEPPVRNDLLGNILRRRRRG